MWKPAAAASSPSRRNQAESAHAPVVRRRARARPPVSPPRTRSWNARRPRNGPKWAPRPTIGDRRGLGLALGVDPRGRATRGGAGNPFLDQGVGVDPAEPEPADRRASGAVRVAAVPGLGGGQDAERAAVVRRASAPGAAKFGGRRQGLVPHRQQDLEQPGRARGRQRVADVRLVRADHARARARRPFAPEGLEALELDGVADRGAGGVALDQVDVARLPARRGRRPRASRGAGPRCWGRAGRRRRRSRGRPPRRRRKCGRPAGARRPAA